MRNSDVSLMDKSELNIWETSFRQALEKVDRLKKTKAGVLLSVIPDRLNWDTFIVAVRDQWPSWKNDLMQYPSCLVLLYAGIAFFEYDEGTFWPQFSKTVGDDLLSGIEQQSINVAFTKAIQPLGLKPKIHSGGTDFVGSAVYYIGIPLSLWGGFLEICEWAFWRKEWKSLPEEEWQEAIVKRCGSRQRLRKFLSDSREVTSSLVKEVLDARELIEGNSELTIKDIENVSILRPEYFDEIIETAEFLRPKDPDSLFRGRARLIFDEGRSKICLQLPGVEQEKLPATWRAGRCVQSAAHGPDELELDSLAFCDWFNLTLESGQQIETQRLRGVGSWALFDLENGGCLVNANRDELRLRSYLLVSQNKVAIVHEGFDTEDATVNKEFELTDGTTCYITNLWPTGKYAQVKINEHEDVGRVIRFKTRNRVEARFFVGWGYKAAYFFTDEQGRIGMDHLPVPSVAIPNGYFRDNEIALSQIFHVTVDDRVSSGRWKKLLTSAPDKEFWEWKWSNKPILEPRSGINKLTSLSQLGEAFKPADLGGEHIFAIKVGQSIQDHLQVKIINRSTEELDDCWRDLPGQLLPFFILCQSLEGLKWEEMLLARDVIAPQLNLSRFLLLKYKKYGFMIQRGNRWQISESRAEVQVQKDNHFRLDYCGNPSILWGLYSYLSKRNLTLKMSQIKVIDKRGDIPFMRMDWTTDIKDIIIRYLKNSDVKLDRILWIQ